MDIDGRNTTLPPSGHSFDVLQAVSGSGKEKEQYKFSSKAGKAIRGLGVHSSFPPTPTPKPSAKNLKSQSPVKRVTLLLPSASAGNSSKQETAAATKSKKGKKAAAAQKRSLDKEVGVDQDVERAPEAGPRRSKRRKGSKGNM